MRQYTVKNSGLQFKYEPGIYECRMCLFRTENRYPRRLAKEQAWFLEDAYLKVGEKTSCFFLPLRQDIGKHFWFFSDRRWTRAARKKEAFVIPAEAFRFTIFQDEIIGEGECLTAWTGQEDEQGDIADFQCRDLNVHIW